MNLVLCLENQLQKKLHFKKAYKNGKKYLHVIFIDLEKTFTRMSKHRLWVLEKKVVTI